jgi:DNA-binding response OmpR family regulator
MLERIFEREGFQVKSVHDGLAALEVAEQLLPDLILLDIQMPGMNGFDVLRSLRQNERTIMIPTILITAKARQPADVAHGLNLGADDYVQKPFEPRELVARVQSKIRAHQLEDALHRRTQELEALLRIVGAPGRGRSSDSAEGRVLELARRLDRDLPRRTRRTLEPLAAALAERPLDRPEAFVAGVELYADRIGLVLSDALVLAVRSAARRDAPETAGSDDLREALRLSPAARDLVRFSVSEEREAIGL